MSILRAIQSLPDIKRNAKRFGEISGVLARYGLGSWMDAGHPEFLKARFRTVDGESIADLGREERIRMALTELGPAFIKLGQVMSTRSDLVGNELASELAKLQADTPADDADTAIRTIEAELGRPLDACFSTFDREPLGSASIGQVHAATLLDGTDVVVKVQHDGIVETIEADLSIMAVMAEVGEENDAEIARYQPVEIVRTFKRQLMGELDYTRERLNIESFQANFDGDESVRFPVAYPEVCARRVLTMDRVDGIAVADAAELDRAGVDRKALAHKGAHIWIQMILRDGFYHADPHPGNILACPDARVGVLDCGMVGRIDERTLEQFEGVVIAILAKDGEELSRQLLRICDAPMDLDRDAFERDVSAFTSEYLRRPVADVDFSAAVAQAFEIMRESELHLPGPVAQLLKTLALLEGTSRQLDRDFNVIELIQPYQKQIIEKRLSPRHLMKRAVKTARDYEELMRVLPQDVMEILERTRKGQFNVRLEHRDLDSVVNRLIYGMVVSALLLGSAWLLGQQTPPTLWGVSIFGLLGGVVASVLGLRLVWAIARHGRLGD